MVNVLRIHAFFSYNIICGFLRGYRKLLTIQSYDYVTLFPSSILQTSLPTLLLNFLTCWSICFPVEFLTLFNIRCSCNRCNNELLVSASEFRCCREVLPAVAKLIEARCVTEHPDFAALTNTTVLQQVGPLLRGKTGSTNILEPVPRMLKMSKRAFHCCMMLCLVVQCSLCHYILVNKQRLVFLCTAIPQAFNFP